MTAQDVADAILQITQDYSYVLDSLLSVINAGMREIASAVLIPELETNDTLTLTGATEDMPSDYMRNLSLCYSTTNTRYVKVYPSLVRLYAHYSKPDITGDVTGVAVSNGKLYVLRVPTSEDLQIWYHKIPTELTTGGNTLELPEQFKMLIVYYGCREIYMRKMAKDFTAAVEKRYQEYEAKFQRELLALYSYAGPYAGRNQEFPDELTLELYLDS